MTVLPLCNNSQWPSINWQPVAASQWHWQALTDSGSQWQTVTEGGRQPVTASGRKWLPVAVSSSQWQPVTAKGSQWPAVTSSDSSWSSVTLVQHGFFHVSGWLPPSQAALPGGSLQPHVQWPGERLPGVPGARCQVRGQAARCARCQVIEDRYQVSSNRC